MHLFKYNANFFEKIQSAVFAFHTWRFSHYPGKLQNGTPTTSVRQGYYKDWREHLR